ncbi:hypothetical protein [Pseudoclavibacter soli]|uniref:hypothetical protein n=1 Tax=Pseudoclavibacter soli TaxID=452623 RepID=UPI0009FBEEFD|nr:hypothetical protein [Pseudoclavibacter soli]
MTTKVETPVRTQRPYLTAVLSAFIGAIVVGVWGLVLYQSVFVHMVWEDEAFNLTVVRNMAEGLGYTSDGVLSGNELAPFDVRISTGPVVLLPAALLGGIGVDLVLAARIVVALYAVLLAMGLYVLGARLHRSGEAERQPGISWVGLLAALTPLTFNTWLTISPIQGPADVLGEFPAAALLVWALIWLDRKPWLAGLLVGLAIQAKFISVLALPAFAVGVLLQGPVKLRERSGRLFKAAVFVALPSFVYEAWVFISLGWWRFRYEHLRDFGSFLLHGYDYGSSPLNKLATFFQAWFLPEILAIALPFLVMGVCVWLWIRRGRRLGSRTVTLLVAALAWLTYVGWWVSSTSTPVWVRHPAIGVIAFTPVLVAGACTLLSEEAGRGKLRYVSRVTLASLLLGLVVQVSGYVDGQLAPGYSLDTQRAEAVELSTTDESVAVPWGLTVSMGVLTGAHVVNLDGPDETWRGLDRILPAGGCIDPIRMTANFVRCSAL